jgi:DNA-dependent protein kinase catalytic subunit
MQEDKDDYVQACYTLFSKFIKEVLVRLQQYKDDLLAACVELVLSVPKQFINVATLVPALHTAFKIGLRYPFYNCLVLTF